MKDANEHGRRAITLAGLWVYPIKSCAGVAVTRAELDGRGGFEGDREWVVVDASGEMVWQGGIPRMALVHPIPSAEGLHLHAPGVPPFIVDRRAPGEACEVKIWNETSRAFDTFAGSDSGPGAEAWFSAVLGRPLRLVRLGDAARQRQSLKPLHVLALPSLRRLNERLSQQGHPFAEVERFRPNLTIDGVEGSLAPFAEEGLAAVGWPRASGALKIDLGDPCVRCVMINIDRIDASVHKEPLASVHAMSSERSSGAPSSFGVYGECKERGWLEVGEHGWAEIRR